MRIITCLIACLGASLIFAQSKPHLVTPANQRLAAAQQRAQMQQNSILAEWPLENIGPSVQSGRVSDISVHPNDPSHFLVAYASGGLWKTTNNGTTFEPLFDRQDVLTMGAVAADWQRNVIWVGTGEVNSSRSSYAGLGLYRSTDGGQSWEHRGLSESHHIGRIILHPDDPNTLWVAVLGHLYSGNPERGIYKTTDGGDSWEKVLFVNNDAGGIELVLDPRDSDHLYAATWERSRRAWNFVESGTGSGIYESVDGGVNWQLLTGPDKGFPNNEGAGRIGLAYTYNGDIPVLYASIDNYNRRPKKDKEDNRLTKARLRIMTAADFADVSTAKLKAYLQKNGFDKKYTPEDIQEMVQNGEISPKTLVEYTESANSLLFDTEVVSLEVYKLDASSKKWERTHEDYIDRVYNSYGYYFGQLRVSPHDPNQLFSMGVPIIRSDDGGANWKSLMRENVHGDHHALWLNPQRAGHLILGNDGGINISYDNGANWIKCNHPPLGQFYYVAVDMAKPYKVYGGLQDNGVWMGNHEYSASPRWQQSGQYGYEMIMGGDGMQVAIDTRDNVTVYTGFQFGNYFRMNTQTGQRKYITPKHDLKERPYRWNWQTPIHLSEHNPDILYMGSNFLHRSLNRGDDFEKISEDLTLGGQSGDVPYGTLTTIHESPLRFGLLYVGSDDGLLHVSKDGGYSWENISSQIPPDMWISRVQASSHQEGRVYVVLNGYRWDNWEAMLMRSDDYGQNWTILGRDLPQETLNVVKEDSKNEELLYVGSDHGAYVSLNGGQTFSPLVKGLAGAPVHDIVVHPRDGDIIIGTHGRSLYLGSAREIQQLNGDVLTEAIHLFEIESMRASSRWGNASWYSNAEDITLQLPIYCQENGTVDVVITAKDGPIVQRFSQSAAKGLQYLHYDLTVDKKQVADYQAHLRSSQEEDELPAKVKAADNGLYYLQTGTYIISVTKDGVQQEKEWELE